MYLSLIDYKFRQLLRTTGKEKNTAGKKKAWITNKSIMEVQAEKRPPPAGTTLYLNFDG